MSTIKRTDLLAKLNMPSRKAVENAMKSAKLRGNRDQAVGQSVL